MKKSGECPKCQSRRIWIVDTVSQPSSESSNGIIPMRVIARPVPSPTNVFRSEAGHFDAYICDGCGYTEWYATNLEQLLPLKGPSATHQVQLIDGNPTRVGPYR
jgi:predicted nucleic-acid-binding Zn-ribbon protein